MPTKGSRCRTHPSLHRCLLPLPPARCPTRCSGNGVARQCRRQGVRVPLTAPPLCPPAQPVRLAAAAHPQEEDGERADQAVRRRAHAGVRQLRLYSRGAGQAQARDSDRQRSTASLHTPSPRARCCSRWSGSAGTRSWCRSSSTSTGRCGPRSRRAAARAARAAERVWPRRWRRTKGCCLLGTWLRRCVGSTQTTRTAGRGTCTATWRPTAPS
mmetsp:Transcript_12926/g.42621  ORF Transcript_12926/g.42621 Transcript_12926/m.42621 type:complete len:213 (+) Transcript_12926:701-1339(+)